MLKKYLTLLMLTLVTIAGMKAQSVYSDPSPLQLSTQDVKVYFDATGTPLAGLNASTEVYAHTGYAVNGNASDWKAAPTWGDNAQKYKLVYQGGNLWMLYIGNIRTYYGIPATVDNVTSLNFVFRTADTKSQTKDMFLTVYEDGLQVNINTNTAKIVAPDTFVKITASATSVADMTMAVNGVTVAEANGVQTLEYEYPITEAGDYVVTASATADGETVTESLTIFCLRESTAVNYPGGTPKMGPVKNADGSVTFCLGAPGKEQVVLCGSWNNYAPTVAQVMDYQDTPSGRYFWTTVSGLANDEMYLYFFIIDGGEYTVGDPYARLIVDPYNDKYIDTNVFPNLPQYPSAALEGLNVPVAIYQGNINDYDWKVKNFQQPFDHNNLIIYELLFRDFTGTEGKADGNGTVRMAIEKLPYLKSLGVNAIELLPIMEFNGNISWGYNPNFYFAVDKAYGTPSDYKEFIDLCHQNGIAVILDMVFNQSDGLHPWYQMYKPGANPFYNQNAPHAYSVLNDWNQGTPMVQEQWADVLRYWMTEYKFDGFRFDLVKGLGLNSSYANNGDAATNAYNKSRVEEMLYLQSVAQEVNPNVIFINENLAGAQEENEMSNTSFANWGNMQLNWANLNGQGCNYAKGQSSNSDLKRFLATDDSRTWGSTISYLESHDEQRLAYEQNTNGVSGIKGKVEPSMQRLSSAAAQMIMTPGAHMIWMFSEMGNAQNTKNSGGNDTDPKIVNWSLLDDPYHYGLFESYSDLINVRNANPELFSQDAEVNISLSGWQQTGRWIVLKNGEKELHTYINPGTSGNPIQIRAQFNSTDPDMYEIISKSYGSEPVVNPASGAVRVPANSYVTIGTTNLSAVESIIDESRANALAAYGGYGEVVVTSAKGLATIYSLEGKVVGSVNQSGSVPAAKGLYIVKCGKNAVKVVVK